MTLLESILRFLTASLLLSSGITISLALFRVPLHNSIIKIVTTGLVMEFISFNFDQYLVDYNIYKYGLLIMIFVEIVFVTFLFKLPFLYSILICIFGFLGSFPVLISVTLLVTELGISSEEIIHSNVLHLYAFRIICSVILLSAAFLFQYKKIGFMLNIDPFQLRNINKGFYLGLFIIIWFGVIVIQYTVVQDKYDSLQFYTYCITFIIGLVVAYKLNKKHIRQKYDK